MLSGKTVNCQRRRGYGEGEQTRARSDSRYYMDPFDILLNEFDGETFNIGADKFFTLNQPVTNIFIYNLE